MAKKTDSPQPRKQQGYAPLGGSKGSRQSGWCHRDDRKSKKQKLPRFMRELTGNQLALFGPDQFVAIAHGRFLGVVRFDDLVALGQDSSSISLKPVADFEAKHPLSHVSGRGSRRPLEVIAAHADDGVV